MQSFVPLPSPPTGDDYRELAQRTGHVAAQTRLPLARGELVRLAASYDRIAFFATGEAII
jgi:hypothetical protein